MSRERHDLARRLRLNRAAQEGSANPGPILVGELNPYGSDPAHALLDEPRGASGWRLRMILGLTSESYLALRRYNLCTGRWSMREARKRAQAIRDAYPGRVLVLLGVKVAGAFGLQDGHPFSAVGESYRDHYSTREAVAMEVGERPTYVMLPHPSGLNRAWNEPGAVERARELVRMVCPEVPVGKADTGAPVLDVTSPDDMLAELNALCMIGIDTPNGSRTYTFRPNEIRMSPRVLAHILGTTVDSPAYRRVIGHSKLGTLPSAKSAGRYRRARVVRRGRP